MTAYYRALAALAALVTIAACSSSHPATRPSPAAEAIAYLRAHPAPAEPGTAVGIVLSAAEAGFTVNGKLDSPPCRFRMTRLTSATFGRPEPLCGAWSATVITATGRHVYLACGDLATGRPCLPLLHDYLPPGPGDYVRFRLDGRTSQPSDVREITEFAVDGILGSGPESWRGWLPVGSAL